jgi:hypothetical protein
MNPGTLSSDLPRFARPTMQYLSERERAEWEAFRSVLAGSTNLLSQAHARRAEHRLEMPDIEYGSADRSRRRAVLKRARPKTERLAHQVRSALDTGSTSRVHRAAEAYFRSFDAKYVAFSKAFESMKQKKRPHVGVLEFLTSNLDMMQPEFEPALLTLKSREIDFAGGQRNRRARPIIEFGIRHRARQQMVKKLLEVCLGDFERQDQYCFVGRGREQAVLRAAQFMRDPQIEFVAECDITDFFPTVGENAGYQTPGLALQDHLPMLPRAVIENTVLAAGVVLQQHPDGLEATNRLTYAGTGMSMGSALSSYLAEYIMSDIMSKAETLNPRGTGMISFVDNIGLFGISLDDIHGMIRPLRVSAETSPFGSFGLRQSQTVRHKSQGFPFLGYFLRWDQQTRAVSIEVSDKNVEKFQSNMEHLLSKCHRSRRLTGEQLQENRVKVVTFLQDWVASFQLAEDTLPFAKQLASEVLQGQPVRVRRYFQRLLDS